MSLDYMKRNRCRSDPLDGLQSLAKMHSRHKPLYWGHSQISCSDDRRFLSIGFAVPPREPRDHQREEAGWGGLGPLDRTQ